MLQKLRFIYKLFRQLMFPHTYQDSSVQPKCPNTQILLTSYICLSPYVIFLSSFIGILFGKVPWLVDSDSISTQCQYIDIIVNKKCMNSVLQYEYKFTTFQAIPNPKTLVPPQYLSYAVPVPCSLLHMPLQHKLFLHV